MPAGKLTGGAAPLIEALRTAFAAHADPVRAVPMQAYMLHQFTFLGVSAPNRRAALAPVLRSLKASDVGQLLITKSV